MEEITEPNKKFGENREELVAILNREVRADLIGKARFEQIYERNLKGKSKNMER